MIIRSLKTALKVFLTVSAVCGFFIMIFSVYVYGYVNGYKVATDEYNTQFSSFVDTFIKSRNQELEDIIPTPSAIPTLKPSTTKIPTSVSWGGPELWEAVNKRRQEKGVNPLNLKTELCTIASIRLNELLALGELDNHEGFSNMQERRPDLKWIFEMFSTVSEFLAQGGKTPEETVSMWENTLGHSKLLTGGEYVWGCIYAQNTISVAITAY